MEIHLLINWAIFTTFKKYWNILFHIFIKYYTSQRSHSKIFIIFGAINKSTQNNKNKYYSFKYENRKIHFWTTQSLTWWPHLSSPSSRFDYGDDGADRRYLDDGEINGDGEGTNMITTSRRTDLWHKQTNYCLDRALRRPWRLRWHGDTTPAKQSRKRRNRGHGKVQ